MFNSLRRLTVTACLAGALLLPARGQPAAAGGGNPVEAVAPPLKLTTGQRSQWLYLQGLLKKFAGAADRVTGEIIAREYLAGSNGLREVFPPGHEYWQGRAQMALVLADDKAGKEAAGILLRLKAPAPAAAALLARLQRRGWVQDGSEKSRLGGDFILRALELPMVYLEPGTYVMGSGSAPNEGPVTRVTLTRPFWMGKYEISRTQWRAVMGDDLNDLRNGGLPKVGISWLEAREFCEKLTNYERTAGRIPAGYEFTLPTEAQWEYACRAGTTTETVTDLDDAAWFDGNSGGRLHPIGEKKPNAWGLCSLLGNASEWCLDYYAENLAGGEQTDPAGPAAGTLRAVRGGNYASPAGNCRPTKRGGAFPEGNDSASDKVGLRIVLSWVGDKN